MSSVRRQDVFSPKDWEPSAQGERSDALGRRPTMPQAEGLRDGYGAFSVSPSNVEAVTRYIANQEENHKRRDFKDELRELLRANGSEWDERTSGIDRSRRP